MQPGQEVRGWGVRKAMLREEVTARPGCSVWLWEWDEHEATFECAAVLHGHSQVSCCPVAAGLVWCE